MNRELREDRDSWRQLAESLRAELKEAQERVNELGCQQAAWRKFTAEADAMVDRAETARTDADERCIAMSADLAAMQIERDMWKDKHTEFERTFAGHVYVKNMEYVNLVAAEQERDQLKKKLLVAANPEYADNVCRDICPEIAQLKRDLDEAQTLLAAAEEGIDRNCAEIAKLKRERDECRDTLELREQERDQWHAPCCTMEMRAIKAYRQGFETCREAAAIAADEYAEKCMLYDETDGIEKEAIGCVIRALSVPEREVK